MADTSHQGAAQPGGAADGSLLDQIMQQTKMAPADDGYAIAKKGVEAFIGEMLASSQAGAKADKASVDVMIAEIDRKLSRQLDAIMHNATFQRLESGWRSLKLLVDRTDFRENCKIEL